MCKNCSLLESEIVNLSRQLDELENDLDTLRSEIPSTTDLESKLDAVMMEGELWELRITELERQIKSISNIK